MVVVPPVQEDLAALKEQLFKVKCPDPAVRVAHRLEDGDPARAIVQVAREVPCDLIILGTHGRRGLARLLMGSVAEQVVRKAPCPVVTVRTPFPAAPREKPTE